MSSNFDGGGRDDVVNESALSHWIKRTKRERQKKKTSVEVTCDMCDSSDVLHSPGLCF